MAHYTVPSPLPLNWNLCVHIQCPQCGGMLQVVEGSEGGNRVRVAKHMYCPDVGCKQFGNVYEVEISLSGARVRGIVMERDGDE